MKLNLIVFTFITGISTFAIFGQEKKQNFIPREDLQEALFSGDTGNVTMALKYGADPNLPEKVNFYPYYGHKDKIPESLLDQKKDAVISPFAFVIINGLKFERSSADIQYLIMKEHGASLSSNDIDVLIDILGCYIDKESMIKWEKRIFNSLKPNTRANKNALSAIGCFAASFRGSAALAEKLIQLGADPNYIDPIHDKDLKPGDCIHLHGFWNSHIYEVLKKYGAKISPACSKPKVER